VIYAHRRQLIKSALVSRCVLPLQYCDARDNARRARARARVADDKERQSQRKIRRSLVIFIYITNAACNTMRKARNIPSEKPCFFSFLIATADVRFPVEPELTRARAKAATCRIIKKDTRRRNPSNRPGDDRRSSDFLPISFRDHVSISFDLALHIVRFSY